MNMNAFKQMTFSQLQDKARNAYATAFCGALLLVSGTAHSQEFIDQIKGAKALSTSSMRASAKQGADNIGFIIQIAMMVLGVILVAWGIWWITSASRSDGRKSSAPGWIMAIGGGALGAGMAIYMAIVGSFTGMLS